MLTEAVHCHILLGLKAFEAVHICPQDTVSGEMLPMHVNPFISVCHDFAAVEWLFAGTEAAVTYQKSHSKRDRTGRTWQLPLGSNFCARTTLND